MEGAFQKTESEVIGVKQLRIVYDLGFDENGVRRYRRQTLPLVSDATNDQIQSFISNLANVLSVPIDTAIKVTYETIV